MARFRSGAWRGIEDASGLTTAVTIVGADLAEGGLVGGLGGGSAAIPRGVATAVRMGVGGVASGDT
jgi:hypothetical protein